MLEVMVRVVDSLETLVVLELAWEVEWVWPLDTLDIGLQVSTMVSVQIA